MALSDTSDDRYLYPSTLLLWDVLTEYSTIALAKPPSIRVACPSKIILFNHIIKNRLVYNDVLEKRRCRIIYYLIRRILLFYQVLDNFDYFVGISLIELSTGQ